MKKEIKFSEDLSGILEVGNIDWSIFKSESKTHYIGIINPPRFGVALFATMLEHIYFPPKTKKNGLFWLQFLSWGTIISDKSGRLEVFAKDAAIVSDTKKVIRAGDKEFMTAREWDIQMLKWMIVSIPTEYKIHAEACLKKINMIPSPASPVLSKFRISVDNNNSIELPFIAAVKSYKLKQNPQFPGPFRKMIELDPNHINYFPVEGSNIFTIENGPGDHNVITKMGLEKSINLERQLCEKISGFTDSSPEEKDRINKLSKKVMNVIDKMMHMKG